MSSCGCRASCCEQLWLQSELRELFKEPVKRALGSSDWKRLRLRGKFPTRYVGSIGGSNVSKFLQVTDTAVQGSERHSEGHSERHSSEWQ